MGRKRVISHRDLVRDLDRGAVGEDIAVNFLKKQFGVIATSISERNPDCDFVIEKIDKSAAYRTLTKVLKESFGFRKKKKLTVEVKLDEAAEKYGNLFIELFFDIEEGVPGNIFKCKADMFLWIVPNKKKYRIHLFNRAEFLAWLFQYVFENRSTKMKTPGISPYARGLAIPIKKAISSKACIGSFDFNYKGK